MGAGGFVNLSQSFDQPALVDGPDLIQDNLARLALEPNRHTCGIRTPLGGHGGYDNRIDVEVHFVWGDDQAGASLADFTAFGWV